MAISNITQALTVLKNYTGTVDKAGDTLNNRKKEDGIFSFIDLQFLANSQTKGKPTYNASLIDASKYILKNRGQFLDYFDSSRSIFNIQDLEALDVKKPPTPNPDARDVEQPKGGQTDEERTARLLLNVFDKVDALGKKDGGITKKELTASLDSSRIGAYSKDIFKKLIDDTALFDTLDTAGDPTGKTDGRITVGDLGAILGNVVAKK